MTNDELVREIEGLVVQGNNLRADFSAAVTSMSVDLPINAIPRITLDVDDPKLRLWSRGMFIAGTPPTSAGAVDANGAVRIVAGTAGSPVAWRDTRWEVVEVTVGAGGANGGFTVGLAPEVFCKMARAAGEQAWDEISVSAWLADRVKAAGGTLVAQASPAPQAQIAREGGNDPESDLDVADRLAGAEKRTLLWSFGTVYYGAPTWLAKNLPTKTLQWPSGGDLELYGIPECSRSAEDKTKAAKITASVAPRHATELLALPAIDAAGIAQFRGRYLMSKLSWQVGVPGGLELELQTPVDPLPDLGDDPGGPLFGIDLPNFATEIPTGGKTVKAFVQLARQQAGDRYRMGSGRNLADGNPDEFDCSGLVYWSAGQLGVTVPATAEALYNACRDADLLIPVATGLVTEGALLFVIYPGKNPARKNDHVAISLGTGSSTIEARGTRYGVNIFDGAQSRPWTAAGYLPGLAYS